MMTDWRINLLPHRAWRQAAHRRRFERQWHWTLGVSFGGSLLVCTWLYVEGQSNQKALLHERAAWSALSQRAAIQMSWQHKLALAQSQQAEVQLLATQQGEVAQLWWALAPSLEDGAYLSEMRWTADSLVIQGFAPHQAAVLTLRQRIGRQVTRWADFRVELWEAASKGVSTKEGEASPGRFVVRANQIPFDEPWKGAP